MRRLGSAFVVAVIVALVTFHPDSVVTVAGGLFGWFAGAAKSVADWLAANVR